MRDLDAWEGVPDRLAVRDPLHGKNVDFCVALTQSVRMVVPTPCILQGYAGSRTPGKGSGLSKETLHARPMDACIHPVRPWSGCTFIYRVDDFSVRNSRFAVHIRPLEHPQVPGQGVCLDAVNAYIAGRGPVLVQGLC